MLQQLKDARLWLDARQGMVNLATRRALPPRTAETVQLRTPAVSPGFFGRAWSAREGQDSQLRQIGFQGTNSESLVGENEGTVIAVTEVFGDPGSCDTQYLLAYSIDASYSPSGSSGLRIPVYHRRRAEFFVRYSAYNGVTSIQAGRDCLETSRPNVVVGVYKRNQFLKLFVNGILEASGTPGDFALADNAGTGFILTGCESTYNPGFFGVLAGGTFARAFSDAEVRQISRVLGKNYYGSAEREVLPYFVLSGSAVPSITAVSAENITATSANYRVTLDYA